LHSFRATCTGFLVSAVLGLGAPAFAQTPAASAAQSQDVAALRAAIDQLKQQLDTLQQKVTALESAAAAAPAQPAPPAQAVPPAAAEVPPAAAGAGAPGSTLPVYSNQSALS